MKSNHSYHRIFHHRLVYFCLFTGAGSKDSFYQRSGFTLSLAYEGEP